MPNEPQLAIESIAGQRPYQEDAVLAQPLSDGRLLVAVADGMGGHAAGEVASALALEALVAALEDGKALDTAFALANRRVHARAREPDKKGMGTTLTAALVDDGEYFVANVGDSRGYLVTADGIRQVTDDHSFVAEAVKRGQTRAEAESTPWRDALTRSIGTEEHVEVDVFGPFPVRPHSALLLCSDGLYKVLSDQQLESLFRQSSSVRGAARALVATALELGSDDNISVAIVEYGEVPREVAQGTVSLDYAPDADDDLGSVAAAVGAGQATVEPAAGSALPGAVGGSDAARLPGPPESRPGRTGPSEGSPEESALATDAGPDVALIARVTVAVIALLAALLAIVLF